MKESGSTSEQSRRYNERIILQLVRQYSEISRVSIAERTGLSAQTISVITSSLLDRGLLQITGKVKGKRGQPSINLSINETGAYGLGINLDRNHISAALLDFSGKCVLLLEREVSFPSEKLAKEIAQDLIEEVKNTLGDSWGKVQGIGFSRPDYMDSWLDTLVTNMDQRAKLNELKAALAYWQSNAFETWLSELTNLTCFCQIDSAAAATSELFLVTDQPRQDFFYLFVSVACGGSFVANGECYLGSSGKAGSFGLIPSATGKHGKWVLEALSLSSLYRFLALHRKALPSHLDEWEKPKYAVLINQWAHEVALEVQPALASVIALYDPEVILLGGRLPAPVQVALATHLTQVQTSQSVMKVPPIKSAHTAYIDGVLGAAILPIYEMFAPQRNVLLLGEKGK